MSLAIFSCFFFSSTKLHILGPASEDSSSLLDGKIASIREDENFIQGDDIDGMTSVHSDKPADVSSAGDCDFLQDVFMASDHLVPGSESRGQFHKGTKAQT